MTIDDNKALGRWWRSLFLDLLPLLTILLLIVWVTLPFGLPIVMRVGGLWPLIGITYWTLVRPRSMGLLAVFVFGLLTDLVTFLPLGIHAFVFIAAQAVLNKQRRFLIGQGFWVLWVAFAFLAVAAAIFIGVLSTLLGHGQIDSLRMLWSVAMATAFLPLLLWGLDRIHHMMDLFDEPV